MKKPGVVGLAPLLLVGLLAACSTFTAPPPPKSVPTIPTTARTVAILAEAPNQVQVETAGTTFLENALDIVNVRDWHMPDLVYETAAATLSRRFTVTRATSDVFISVPESEFDKWRHSTKLEALVRQHAHVDEPVDLYVVISLSHEADIDVDMKNVYRGIGISKVKSPFKAHAPIVHTFMLVTVLDGKTFKTLGYSPLMVSPEDSKKLVDKDAVKDMPQQTLTGFVWHNTWHEMSAAQKRQIETSVKNLLTKSVAYTLGQMLPADRN
jgi:hypothetical protein